ncbi:uncharacterized protein LOC106473621 [Limulus polyphemus]|uniref:Uncharacterized protein LOC106473621 n=1 Tax=Limulus polyphemus TaxID=6850 RepID=A0ABM1TPD2_LIMPO|nr:uncharacterized protein LOC106473621 [Limulus polyphemus]
MNNAEDNKIFQDILTYTDFHTSMDTLNSEPIKRAIPWPCWGRGLRCPTKEEFMSQWTHLIPEPGQVTRRGRGRGRVMAAMNLDNFNNTPCLNTSDDSGSDNDILRSINNELNYLKEKRYKYTKHDSAGSRNSPRAETVGTRSDGYVDYHMDPSRFSVIDMNPPLNDASKTSDKDTSSSSPSISFQPNIKGVQPFNESNEEICSASIVKYPSDNQTHMNSTSTKKSNTRTSDVFVPLPAHLRDRRNIAWELESDFPLLTSDKPSVKVTKNEPSSLVSVAKSLLSEVPVALNADSSIGTFNFPKPHNASDIQKSHRDKHGYSANSRTLVIENLPSNLDEAGLKDFLVTFGRIEDLTLHRIGNTASVAYVLMSPEADMQWIIECLNGSSPFGDFSDGEIVCRMADARESENDRYSKSSKESLS